MFKNYRITTGFRNLGIAGWILLLVHIIFRIIFMFIGQLSESKTGAYLLLIPVALLVIIIILLVIAAYIYFFIMLYYLSKEAAINLDKVGQNNAPRELNIFFDAGFIIYCLQLIYLPFTLI